MNDPTLKESLISLWACQGWRDSGFGDRVC